MKNLLTILLLTFAQNNHKTYYKSGQLEMERKFDKSCNCSKVTEYYESGKVRSTKTYLHDPLFGLPQIDGEDVTFYEDGTIQSYYFWKDGSREGRVYSNFADGNLFYEMFYANKYKSGTWKYYNKDGTLREERIFSEHKTSSDSNNDNAINKFYFNNKLAYTVELVEGRKTNLTVVDKASYDQLIATEPPLGRKLFLQYCTSCHQTNVDLIGPMMAGVRAKRSDEWLTKMITNGDALIKSGDKDAIELYKKWKNIQHPNFERFSNDEVTAIIDYLKTLKVQD